MRINRQILLDAAADAVAQRVRQSHGLLCAFLCGSLLGDDCLLGGATDVDLVFIHFDSPTAGREIVRLTDEVHLDIAHYAQRDFREPRRLRLHPWLGPTLFSARSLHDPQHFLDFVQASVRGQFERPDNVLHRSRSLMLRARQEWAALAEDAEIRAGTPAVYRYLRAIASVVNAIACLSGPPLTERRLLLGFPDRAAAIDRPGLYIGVLGLLGASRLAADALFAWLKHWEMALEALPEGDRPIRLHPARFGYYRQGIRALLEGEQPLSALWPLLYTWTLAASRLPKEHPALGDWQAACQQLELHDAAFGERLKALDAFLDSVEAILEDWARRNGV